MDRKSALGKGLSSLLSDAEIGLVNISDTNITELPLNMIYPNPYQPRKTFDEEEMNNLIDSIKESGIIQPIIVRKVGERYEIVSGERRFRAAVRLKRDTIPSIIKDVSENGMIILSLIENIQREDLNPIELAEGIEKLIEQHNLTHEEVAKKIGIDRATVTNLLRILRLPEKIKEGLRKGEISMGHAKVLLSIDDPSLMIDMYRVCIQKRLSVRELENLLITLHKKKGASRKRVTPFQFNEYRDRLTEIFHTKIDISHSKKGNGKIIINYSNENDLNRIISLIYSIKN